MISYSTVFGGAKRFKSNHQLKNALQQEDSIHLKTIATEEQNFKSEIIIDEKGMKAQNVSQKLVEKHLKTTFGGSHLFIGNSCFH